MNQDSPDTERSSVLNDDELLTSYLDGELSDEQRIEVEARLANEAEFRANLHRLQRTWDILDELPQAKLKNSFTQSTIEMVVADAQRESRKQRRRRWDWPFRIALLIAIPTFAFLLSWSVMHYWQDTPNREVINRLPVIDNVDLYLKAESVDFLTQLRDTGLFKESDEEIIDTPFE